MGFVHAPTAYQVAPLLFSFKLYHLLSPILFFPMSTSSRQVLGAASCDPAVSTSSSVELTSLQSSISTIPFSQNPSALEIAIGITGIVLGIIAIGVAVLQLKKMKRNRKVYFELA
jgi:hypothetical protein